MGGPIQRTVGHQQRAGDPSQVGPHTALEVLEQERASLRDRLELRHMLVMVGAMSDRQVALRYADDTIAIWSRLSGASLAARISPWLGGHLAFALALIASFVSWASSFGRRARPGPLRSLHLFYVEVAYLCSVRSLSSWAVSVSGRRKFSGGRPSPSARAP